MSRHWGLQVARKAGGGGWKLHALLFAGWYRQLSDWADWLKDHPQPYELGENESHIAFATDDFEAAHRLHEEMGCILLWEQRDGNLFYSWSGWLLAGGCSGIGTCLDIRKHLHFFAGVFICGYRWIPGCFSVNPLNRAARWPLFYWHRQAIFFLSS